MSTISQLWVKMLEDIYKIGHYHRKDDAEIKEILNVSGWIDNPAKIVDGTDLRKSKFIDFVKDGI